MPLLPIDDHSLDTLFTWPLELFPVLYFICLHCFHVCFFACSAFALAIIYIFSNSYLFDFIMESFLLPQIVILFFLFWYSIFQKILPCLLSQSRTNIVIVHYRLSSIFSSPPAVTRCFECLCCLLYMIFFYLFILYYFMPVTTIQCPK